MKISEARAGLAMVTGELAKEHIDGTDYWMARDIPAPPVDSTAWLLPGFDEYLLGYKDRSAVLDRKYASRIVPGNNGMFMPTIVVDGRVVGTWKRTFRKNSATIEAAPFADIGKAAQRSLDKAAQRFGDYVDMPVSISV